VVWACAGDAIANAMAIAAADTPSTKLERLFKSFIFVPSRL
jgi:hypothetical protein